MDKKSDLRYILVRVDRRLSKMNDKRLKGNKIAIVFSMVECPS